MFAYLEGKVADKDLNALVLDVGGIGFQVTCSMNTVHRAPEKGATMKVYTYLSVREDGMELFGFSSREELNMFRSLTAVSGIGPKTAVQILSSMSLKDLTKAIMDGDVNALSRAQGVGKKTAQRMALELKSKVTDEELKAILGEEASSARVLSEAGGPGDGVQDTLLALQSLGYTPQEAQKAVAAVRGQSTDPNELLRLALRNI